MAMEKYIGPHEGQELALMLAGAKKLAVFHDLLRADIPEEIIPERAFAPYVADGRIIRYSEDIHSIKLGKIIHYVCFALPDEAWRINAFFFIKRAVMTGKRPLEDGDDIMIGRLLGYTEAGIKTFLSYRKTLSQVT